ncbi:MAG TPA: NAD(P)H-hydrate dehydratase [Streptosporangiaceae bacterium]|nr:NAD(P)H-hydrate dehydratase [Streptosporangiaceae bacterium]
MRDAHAVADVRAAERALMALVPDGALMQRAAAGLASVCAGLLGRVYGSRVVVLAGTGDNGGDALFAGARLAARGAQVTAVGTGPGLHEAGAAALRLAGGRLAAAGGTGAGGPGAAGPEMAEAIAAADLIIDGILGIGGRGGLREPAATLAALTARAAESGAIVVATDLPSGVDADTGVVAGVAIRADVTVTFGTIKPGLLIDPGASHAGTVELVDIGLRPHLTAPPAVTALQSADVAALLPEPGAESDKYRRGVLGVLAGSEKYTGAAVLSVGGAIRGGAGMVRLVSARAAADVVRQHWPEAVITVIDPADPAGPQPTGSGSSAGPAAIEAAGRVQAWVAGPGLGTGDDAAELLATVLATSLPVLVDADGLTVLSRHKELLARPAGAATLITPHAGELARLVNGDHDQIEAHRLESARAAAAGLGVTVLLKGSTTVVATPDPAEPVFVNPTGTSWLATAGSGDVLSGLAGALLAQGVRPARSAAAAAAFLHGLAGRLAARGAPAGASDVLAAIPEAIRRVAGGDQP